MRFHKQEMRELAQVWKILRHESRIFSRYDQLEGFASRSGNFLCLSDAGVIAVLGRWRPHLSCLAIWEVVPPAASTARVIRDLVESMREEGFAQIISPVLAEKGRGAYLEAGFRDFQCVIKMEKKDLDLPPAAEPAHIVPAQANHLKALVELEREAFPRFWWLDEETFSQFLKTNHFLVALLKDGIVGYNINDVFGRQGTIYRLGVHPRYRSLGIGAQLLAQAISWFAGQKVRSIALTTQKENWEGQRLYWRFGFRILKGTLYILKYDY